MVSFQIGHEGKKQIIIQKKKCGDNRDGSDDT